MYSTYTVVALLHSELLNSPLLSVSKRLSRSFDLERRKIIKLSHLTNFFKTSYYKNICIQVIMKIKARNSCEIRQSKSKDKIQSAYCCQQVWLSVVFGEEKKERKNAQCVTALQKCWSVIMAYEQHIHQHTVGYFATFCLTHFLATWSDKK